MSNMMNIRFSNQEAIFSLHTDGIPTLSFRMLDALGVPNLYTTRYISYDSEKGEGVTGLRLAVMRPDDPQEAAPHTLAQRDRLARQLGSSLSREVITDQKHTNHVLVVTPEDMGPVWPAALPEHRQYVDGLVTDIPEVLLTAFGGDCPPVYLADPVRGAIGLVHAGWRGTLGRIPAVAVQLMKERFGCEPSDIYAAIGPGVCKDCYEMGDEVYDQFAAEWGRADADRILSRYPAKAAAGGSRGEEDFVPKAGKYHLDLRAANRLTLLSAGVQESRIAISNVCTMCNADTFYSYRAHRMENEQVAMIVNRFSKACIEEL